jgi:hypothetical protein
MNRLLGVVTMIPTVIGIPVPLHDIGQLRRRELAIIIMAIQAPSLSPQLQDYWQAGWSEWLSYREGD